MPKDRILRFDPKKGFVFEGVDKVNIEVDNNDGELLFVYGTLRYHNKHLLKDAKLVQKGKVAAENFGLWVVKHLPVLVEYPDNPVGNVFGDVYKVTPELLAELDKFKLVNGVYERRKIGIGWGKEFKCWTYIFPKMSPHICDPDWMFSKQTDYGDYIKSLINEEELLNA